MEYKLDSGAWASVFAVPTAVCDRHIKLAGEAQLKVMLFLLRHGGKSFSAEELCRELGIRSQAEITDAVEFWTERGLIQAVEDGLKPVDVAESPVLKAQTAVSTENITPEKEPAISAARKVELERPPRFSAAEISQKLKSSQPAKHLFAHAEALYKRPLKHSEMQVLMSIVEYAGLPERVAVMLLEYCFSIGKTSMHYIQSLAVAWAEEEIVTIEKAEDKIKELTAVTDIEKKLRREMELSSGFSKKQREYIDAWAFKMNFSAEMIMAAYQITLDSTGKLSFPYMNKILENWYSKGIDTEEKIDEEKLRRAEDSKGESSFSIDELDRLDLEKYRRE